MAKLFEFNYLQDESDEYYLTVGNDDDTNETIDKREYEKMEDKSCVYFHAAREISEVDGYKVVLVKKEK